MILFFDTSALVKRYVDEPGHSDVMALFEQADAIAVSVICFPEIISGLCRLKRERRLSERQYQRIKAEITRDFEDFDIYAISHAVTLQAALLLESNILRGMDALHVACAMEAQVDAFVSADQRQAVAARNVGLGVFEI